MAQFTFECRTCGTFESWIMSKGARVNEAPCPSCAETARRIFRPVHVPRMDAKVKSRIESGMQPKTVQRKDLPAKQTTMQRTPRPWQAGH
ncbi:zinc ribbon domain-containing protein [Marinococcus luteus]|uniref:zinc ribbon domain-containing protein n=1 Tax=Marinococcus luteus TaxID=1122204 RepID=UPI002ACCAAF6|nr:zinc ribbon domain-containing protein [Marinococcus luteus]MDZ5783478.1 zinc ribbon domain-containing protein [Marinococcus luteus]